jgi:hypothetical protein
MTDQQPLSVDATHDALFIIDNTSENGTCLGYLKACTKSSSALDVATGYFDIGALLALDGQWQHLGRIRILMGADTIGYRQTNLPHPSPPHQSTWGAKWQVGVNGKPVEQAGVKCM